MKAIFFRLLEAEDKEAALRAAIDSPLVGASGDRFEVETANFAVVPGSPFAYWVSKQLRGLFQKFSPLESDERTAKVGLQTSDDFRFVRAWWELSPNLADERWHPFAKGGKFSPYYADVYLSLNWVEDGHELKAWAGSLYNNSHWSRILKNTDFFTRPGLTWPRRTNGLSLRAMPSGCIFADKGPAIFLENDSPSEMLALCGVTNSKAFGLLVSLQLARTELAQSYEVGLIQRTPVPDLSAGVRDILSDLGRRAWSAKRALDSNIETSHAFFLPALLQVSGDTISSRTCSWLERVESLHEELESIQREIDAICFRAYGIDDPGSVAGPSVPIEQYEAVDAEDDNSEEGADADSDDESAADETALTSDLVSWGVGVVLGRMDIRLSTGERNKPKGVNPFDPLPACSPGMLIDSAGLPIAKAPPEYPLTIAANGFLADDPGDPLDITAALRAVFDAIFQGSSESWWHDVGARLEPKNDIRAWFNASFFDQHLKRYSKGKRRSPVFWQISVPSGRYSIWLYAHRLDKDSFLNIQHDVVTPKLAHEERQLANLIGAGEGTDRREIERLESFVGELRHLDDEVKRIAPLWKPFLDDGVVLAMAPLSRLVPLLIPVQAAHHNEMMAPAVTE